MTTTLLRDRQVVRRDVTHRIAPLVDSPTSSNKEYTAMLMHEELARERIRDMLQSATERRAARSAGKSRRWARLIGRARLRKRQNH